MLQSVLGDPDAMKKLMGVAEGIMGGSPQKAAEAEPELDSASEQRESETVQTASASLKSLFSDSIGKPGNDERIALVKAIRPYLSEERQHTADSILKLMKMLKLADLGKLIK